MTLISYKKADLKYERLKEYEAGMSLIGTEVKSLRAKHGSLEGSRIIVRGGEAFLVGASIPAFQVVNVKDGYDAERPRRLLLSKEQIAEIADAESKKGLTVVPIEVYNKSQKLKLHIAIVRGKNKRDRREDIKAYDAKRDAEREIRGKR